MALWRRVLMGIGIGLAGCAAPREAPVVGHPSPEVNIAAMRRAARDRDVTAAKSLVHELESDDPAVRFYAINALQRLTGERRGYEFFAPEEKRAEAVERWKQWLESQKNGAHSGPVHASATSRPADGRPAVEGHANSAKTGG